MSKHIARTVPTTRMVSLEMHAHPYVNTAEIETIDTHLKHQWRYSPLFIHPYADTDIFLTGSRRNDYKLAEATTGVKHIPGSTVWHHAWMKDKLGKYKMQLVNCSKHQKTCPHAGGCKLWTIENKKVYRSNGNVYVNEGILGKTIRSKTVYRVGEIRTGKMTQQYEDYIIDFIFNHNRIHTLRMDASSNSNLPTKSVGLWGLDSYGNLFLVDARGQLYFFDHETGKLTYISLNESDIIK
jgi:hypothetical protein